MKQRNCQARSIQNRHNLQSKGKVKNSFIKPIPEQKQLSTSNVPDKVHAEDYRVVFPLGTGDWFGQGFGNRRSLNQRQKRKLKKL